MKVTCVVCGHSEDVVGPNPIDGKFLCPKCFENVKEEYEKQLPTKTLELKDVEPMSVDNVISLESCKVRCPRCGSIWNTSLHVEFCDCLNCGQKLNPRKHVVVSSENEVN